MKTVDTNRWRVRDRVVTGEYATEEREESGSARMRLMAWRRWEVLDGKHVHIFQRHCCSHVESPSCCQKARWTNIKVASFGFTLVKNLLLTGLLGGIFWVSLLQLPANAHTGTGKLSDRWLRVFG